MDNFFDHEEEVLLSYWFSYVFNNENYITRTNSSVITTVLLQCWGSNYHQSMNWKLRVRKTQLDNSHLHTRRVIMKNKLSLDNYLSMKYLFSLPKLLFADPNTRTGKYVHWYTSHSHLTFLTLLLISGDIFPNPGPPVSHPHTLLPPAIAALHSV